MHLTGVFWGRVFLLVVISVALFEHQSAGQSLLDRDWQSNTVLQDAKSFTLPDIGACQGVAILNNKLYFYGDRYDLSPRRGEVHEYTLEMKPTGRRLILNQKSKPVLTHPTGIAYLDKNNVFLGNTVNQQARIYLIDWERAWEDGNLNHAIKQVIKDDLAVNGCRPILISALGRRFVATADYGDKDNQVRLYDPQKLALANKTSDHRVLVDKFSIGAFNQNLDWHAESGQVVGIQNVVAGLGWRLQFVDFENAMSDGFENKVAETDVYVFPAHTELEGFRRLPNGHWIMVTAHKKDNVWIGKARKIKTTQSKRGQRLPYFGK